MATADQLLSTKNQEKMNKIKKNSEDSDAKDLGGPDATWTTAQYANFSFDATQGIKADTTIPKAVGAESMPKLKTVKEAEETDDEDKDKLTEDGDEEFNFDKKKGDDDDEEKEEEAVKDVDEDAMIGDDVNADDDALELNLDDLTDGDTELVELADDEDDAEIPVDDEPVDEPTDDDLVIPGSDEEIPSEEPMADEDGEDVADEMPEFEISDDESADEDVADDEEAPLAHGEGGDDELDEADDDETDVNIHIDSGEAHKGDDDDDEEAEDKKEVDEAKMVKGEKMPKLKTVKEAKKPSSEKMPKIKVPKTKGLKENKVRISFKLSETKKLFEGNTTLTTEDKRQSRVLFESAVRTAAKQIGQQISETYKARYTAAKRVSEAKTARKVNQYLTYVVEQWAKDNKLALQNQLRNKLSENFIRGMKNLFVEHYIEVPTSKVNVVEALAKQVKSLKGKLHEQETKIVTLHTEMKTAVARERKSLVQEHKAKLIAEAAAAVVAADRGSFTERAGTVKFGNTKSFKKDLVALREQYFGTKSSAGRPARMSDAAPLFEEKKHQPKSSAMDAYIQATGKLSGQS